MVLYHFIFQEGFYKRPVAGPFTEWPRALKLADGLMSERDERYEIITVDANGKRQKYVHGS